MIDSLSLVDLDSNRSDALRGVHQDSPSVVISLLKDLFIRNKDSCISLVQVDDGFLVFLSLFFKIFFIDCCNQLRVKVIYYVNSRSTMRGRGVGHSV